LQSPCIDICKIDRSSRLCTGCWRSIDEITQWSQMTDAERSGVMNELQGRKLQWLGEK